MSKQKTNLRIQPTLSQDNLEEGSFALDLTLLADLLDRLQSKYEIKQIEISGRNLGNLSVFYQDMLLRLCLSYVKKVDVLTDFTKLCEPMINDNVNLFALLDFKTVTDTIYQNISATTNNKTVGIKSYDMGCFYTPNISQYINRLNSLHIKSFEILPTLPYSKEVAQFLDYTYYEKVVSTYLSYLKQMNFAFINKLQIDGIQNLNKYNTINLLIDYKGNLIYQTYQDNYVTNTVYSDLTQLDKAIEVEDKKIENYCNKCPFKLKCLADIINPDWKGQSCSGYKNLIK